MNTTYLTHRQTSVTRIVRVKWETVGKIIQRVVRRQRGDVGLVITPEGSYELRATLLALPVGGAAYQPAQGCQPPGGAPIAAAPLEEVAAGKAPEQGHGLSFDVGLDHAGIIPGRVNRWPKDRKITFHPTYHAYR